MHYLFMNRVSRKYLDGYRVYDGKIIFGIGLALIIMALLMLLLYDYAIVRYILLSAVAIGLIVKRKGIISLFKEVKKD